jgi:hypothetical protein
MRRRSRMKLILGLSVLVAFLLAPPAMASDEEATTIYRRKTVYNFANDTITAGLQRPDGGLYSDRGKAPHKNLIRIREDFKNKVLQSAKNL